MLNSVIIVNDSENVFAGFAGNDTPTVVFPSVLGYFRPEFAPSQGIQDFLVGEEAIEQQFKLVELINPAEDGYISELDGEFDDINAIWSETFLNKLRVDSSQYSTLITERALNLSGDRERATQIMMENFGVPNYITTSNPEFALLTSGRTTGLVVEIVNGYIDIVPIIDGVIQRQAVRQYEFGGQELTDYLGNLLNDKGYPFNLNSVTDRQILEDIKDTLGYVAFDYQAQLDEAATSNVLEQTYQLPDGSVLVLEEELFQVPEALFQPQLIGGVEEAGIDNFIFDAMQGLPVELRPEVYSNIILTGQDAKFDGLAKRLKKELEPLAPDGAAINIKPSGNTPLAWQGASIWASVEANDSKWVSQAEYDAFGPSIINQKIATGVISSNIADATVHIDFDPDSVVLVNKILEDSPVAYWSFDDSDGITVINQGSATGIDGILFGNPQITEGLAQGSTDAIFFDGIDDGIAIPDNDAINTGADYPQRTIELRFSAADLDGYQMLYEEGANVNGFNLFLNDDQLTLGAYANNSGEWIATDIVADQTYHVVLTYDNGELTGYLNGLQFASTTAPSSIPSHPGDIGIGQVRNRTRYSNTEVSPEDGDFFHGFIDEVALYNSALSASQIANRYLGLYTRRVTASGGNGIQDAGEPFSQTDGTGTFSRPLWVNLEFDSEDVTLVATGGTDVNTGLALTIPLKAPYEDANISPISTLVTELMDEDTSVAEATTQIQTALDLPTDLNPIQIDYIEELENGLVGAEKIFGASAKVVNTVTATANYLSGAGNNLSLADSSGAIFTTLAQHSDAGQMALDNANLLATVISESATQLSLDQTQLNTSTGVVANLIANTNDQIDTIIATGGTPEDLLNQVSAVKSEVQGNLASTLQDLSAGVVTLDSLVADFGVTLAFGQRPNRLIIDAFVDGELVGSESGSQNGIVPSVDPFSIFAIDSAESNPNKSDFVDRTWFDQGEGIGIRDGDDGNNSTKKKIDGDEILGIAVAGYNAQTADIDLFKVKSSDGAEIKVEALLDGVSVDSEIFSLGTDLSNSQQLGFVSENPFDTLYLSANDADTTFFFKKVTMSGFELFT